MTRKTVVINPENIRGESSRPRGFEMVGHTWWRQVHAAAPGITLATGRFVEIHTNLHMCMYAGGRRGVVVLFVCCILIKWATDETRPEHVCCKDRKDLAARA
jgi:hypothetical protein